MQDTQVTITRKLSLNGEKAFWLAMCLLSLILKGCYILRIKTDGDVIP